MFGYLAPDHLEAALPDRNLVLGSVTRAVQHSGHKVVIDVIDERGAGGDAGPGAVEVILARPYLVRASQWLRPSRPGGRRSALPARVTKVGRMSTMCRRPLYLL